MTLTTVLHYDADCDGHCDILLYYTANVTK